MKKIVVSFSGGKDSTLGLHRLLQSNEWQIDSLLTTFSQESHRTSSHQVREELIEQQAAALGIPLRKVYLPDNSTNEEYEHAMGEAFQQIFEAGATHIMFGDIHLQDLKEYREIMVHKFSLEAVFPLWGESTESIMAEFLYIGFKTVVTAVDGTRLDTSFAGRTIDDHFLSDLPFGVDRCGENGEFHTFVFDGPIFARPINFKTPEKLIKTIDANTGKERFYYVDLLPG
ncbi:Dph6-related ATP pyrophosphatase [Neobacillus dielmonensis]|uniref:Dph6-related ATP pyrophosphatase n=1 Tax=Neobacillus dielmonensis TaxID=1347369 RepID=UPI0005AB65D3|nr:diphthine--ammonia ligase [Neobacillus dielmonensis]